MTTLTELIRASASAADIAHHLDEQTAQERVRQGLACSARDLKRLYERVKGHARLEVTSFVPAVEATVTYELKNSLPIFNVAQKRFFRPATGEVVGYNHTGPLLPLTGPGYFFVINGDDGELVFDYTRLPVLRPPGWPPVEPNTGLVAGPTYANMLDFVRFVSKHTVIGAAFRGGKPRNAYFLLTRSAAEA